MKFGADNHVAKRTNPGDFGDFFLQNVQGQRFHLSCEISACTWWIGTKLCTDITGAQRMKPNDFSDPLTFPVWTTTGWIHMFMPPQDKL